MSDKIKSTIELAMEKAARLPRLTKEEIQQRQERTYGPWGRAIAERFLRGELAERNLEGELDGHPGEEGEIVRRAFLATLCRSIDLEAPETLTRAFEGIGVLVHDEHLEEASERLGVIFRDYQEQSQQAYARMEEAETALLRELGISGSAIRLDLRQNQRWMEKRAELLQRFRPEVEAIQRELGDRLAGELGHGGAADEDHAAGD